MRINLALTSLDRRYGRVGSNPGNMPVDTAPITVYMESTIKLLREGISTALPGVEKIMEMPTSFCLIKVKPVALLSIRTA